MRVLIIVLSVLALGAAAGCGDAPEQADCEKLLDHVLDLQTQAAGANATADAKKDLAKQKKAVADSIGKDFMKTCLDKLPMAQVKCGLDAKTMVELADCDKVES